MRDEPVIARGLFCPGRVNIRVERMANEAFHESVEEKTRNREQRSARAESAICLTGAERNGRVRALVRSVKDQGRQTGPLVSAGISSFASYLALHWSPECRGCSRNRRLDVAHRQKRTHVHSRVALLPGALRESPRIFRHINRATGIRFTPLSCFTVHMGNL